MTLAVPRVGRLVTVVLALLVGAAAVAEDGQRSRVRVAQLAVPDDAPQLEAIAEIVTETVAITLRLLGRYDVLGADAAAADVDSVVGGTVTREETGAIRFELEVRHGITGEQTLETVHVAPSLFDVFDVADEATVALLQGIAERRILFGKLRVTPDRAGDPFTVVLNGETIASTEGEYVNERVIEGSYDLAIVQERPTGPQVIAERAVEVVAGTPATVDVAIPLIRDDEVELLRAELPADDDAAGTPAFADLWAPGGSGTPDRLAQVAGGGVFPARDAVARYYEDNAGLAARTASYWTAGSNEPGVIAVSARTVRVDGDSADWRGVPALALGSTPAGSSAASATVRIALDGEGEDLYLLFEGAGGRLPPGASYRITIAPDGKSFPAAGALELEIEPAADRYFASGRIWSSGARNDYESFGFDSWIVPGGNMLEAVVDVEDAGLDRPFSLAVAVVQAGETVAESAPRWVRAVPSLRQRPSTGLPLGDAFAQSDLTPVAGRGAALLGEALIGAFHETAHASIISVDDSWRPQLIVVDNGMERLLHIGLHGVPDADSVTVDGPDESGIVGLELEEDGRYSGANGDGYYSARISRPEVLEPGDVYRFSVERAGFAMETTAAIESLPWALAEDLAVTASPDGHEFSWEASGDAAERMLVIADGAVAIPYADSWRHSVTVQPDATSVTLPPYRLGASGELRAHLLSRHANGNLWWNVTTFAHGPIFADAAPIPRRTITIDGNPDDWEGLPDFGDVQDERRWNGRNILSVTRLLLAADDDYLYWAIESSDGSLLSEAIPQLNIYTTYDERLAMTGALTAVLRDNENGSEFGYDHWTNDALKVVYEDGFRAITTPYFAEMRISRDTIPIEQLEMNLVVWEYYGATRAHGTRHFRVVMPE